MLANPQFHVTIKRFNNFDPFNTSPHGSSGGYALEAMQVIHEEHPDVLAIFGDYLPQTAIYTAAMASYYEIPYCNPAAFSNELLDRRKYGYFMQMENMSWNGLAVMRLFQQWNVKRITLICSRTYASMCNDMKVLSQQNGIVILANIDLDSFTDLDGIHYIGKTLLRVDARYIFIFGDSNRVADLYYELASKKIAHGPGYVWIGQYPYGTFKTIELYGPDYFKFNKGFINFFAQNYVTPQMAVVNDNFIHAVQNVSALPEFNIIDANAVNMLQGYDCTGLLLAGVQKMMLSATYSPSLMNSTYFMNTDFVGVEGDPLQVTNTGDLAAPFQFVSFDGVSIEEESWIPFAILDVKNGSFRNNVDGKTPVFYDNTTIPPPDGPILAES
ncbi:UNVERIFIED_CONTAM: hypothetical protein HDU68_002224, partial [Siphonaria sp. JEL0065]